MGPVQPVLEKWVGLCQPIFYVIEDVVAVFETYGNADEAGGDADGGAFRVR